MSSVYGVDCRSVGLTLFSCARLKSVSSEMMVC